MANLWADIEPWLIEAQGDIINAYYYNNYNNQLRPFGTC